MLHSLTLSTGDCHRMSVFICSCQDTSVNTAKTQQMFNEWWVKGDVQCSYHYIMWFQLHSQFTTLSLQPVFTTTFSKQSNIRMWCSHTHTSTCDEITTMHAISIQQLVCHHAWKWQIFKAKQSLGWMRFVSSSYQLNIAPVMSTYLMVKCRNAKNITFHLISSIRRLSRVVPQCSSKWLLGFSHHLWVTKLCSCSITAVHTSEWNGRQMADVSLAAQHILMNILHTANTAFNAQQFHSSSLYVSCAITDVCN